MTGTVKHHQINDDLWQLLEAAKQLAAGNPHTSAPAEVRDRAQSQVAALRKALLKAHEQDHANAPVSDVDEIIRQAFHHHLPLPLHMKDVVNELKAASADADDLLRQAEQVIHNRE